MGPGHPQREREGASPGRGEPGNHLLSSGGQIAKPNVSVFEHCRQSSIKVAHSETSSTLCKQPCAAAYRPCHRQLPRAVQPRWSRGQSPGTAARGAPTGFGPR